MRHLVKNFEQFVNESWDSDDSREHGLYSNCCGAEVIDGDICSECGEHCDVDGDYEEFPEDQAGAPEFEPKNFEDDDRGLYEKKSRKEVLKDAKEKYPNLKPGSMKKGLEKMKGADFKEKAEKNFGWAKDPAAAAAAYIRKATGKEPRDV